VRLIITTLTALIISFKAFSTDTADLLNFLALFGTHQDYVLPAFNNYYQDISEGGGYSYLGQLSLVNDTAFFTPDQQLIADTTKWKFEWRINDELLTNRASPQIYSFQELICDGVVSMKLTIIDRVSSASFEREEYAYLGFNYIADCDCPACPSQIDVFYTFYPEVSDYFFQNSFSEFDYNQDNYFDTSDALVFLTLWE
tara:strand:- start:3558 stop:4154 length:597 start_codon:yes stop_codon:yes gene_type:complete